MALRLSARRTLFAAVPQYTTVLSKNANCLNLASETAFSEELPVMRGPRLFLPESWTKDTLWENAAARSL